MKNRSQEPGVRSQKNKTNLQPTTNNSINPINYCAVSAFPASDLPSFRVSFYSPNHASHQPAGKINHSSAW
jgi:hypothetical protein